MNIHYSKKKHVCTVIMIKGDVTRFKDRISLVYLFACVAAAASNLWRAAVFFWIDADRVGSPESAAGKCHFPLDVPGKYYTCFKTNCHMPGSEMFSYLRPPF